MLPGYVLHRSRFVRWSTGTGDAPGWATRYRMSTLLPELREGDVLGVQVCASRDADGDEARVVVVDSETDPDTEPRNVLLSVVSGGGLVTPIVYLRVMGDPTSWKVAGLTADTEIAAVLTHWRREG